MIAIEDLHHTYDADRPFTMMALLLPTQGNVWVNGMNTKDPQHLTAIRHMVGMVFQVPDNQLVATVVEEDVAFGPENMGRPHRELRERVDEALTIVDMTDHRSRPPHLLSAGQKQRVAIAGAIAMRPTCLVLDEATSMLDPRGRRDVLDTVLRLHAQGITIVSITHFMCEAVEGTRVIVMDQGTVAIDGPPQEVFSQAGRLRQLGLDVTPVTQLAEKIHRRRPDFPESLLSVEACVEELCRYPPSGEAAS